MDQPNHSSRKTDGRQPETAGARTNARNVVPSGRSAQGLRMLRLLGLMRKEFLQIARDPSSIIIAGVLPLVLLFLFAFGVSLDLRNIHVAVVAEQRSPQTDRFLESFSNSRYFRVEFARSRHDPLDRLANGRLQGVVILAADFEQRWQRGEQAPVQVIVRGTDPNTAALVENYVQGAWSVWLTQEMLQHGLAGTQRALVTAEPRVWFNPELESRNVLLTGSIAVIMTLIGTLLTALVVAREWERGTMEAILATPASSAELLIGKFIPYFVLGMGAMLLSAGVATTVLGVPFRGSLPMLIIVSAAFLCGALGLGLLISTLSRNQFVASQAALISGFLPAFELSGLVFEIGSMPAPIRAATRLMPARYFVSALQTLFLAGDVPSVIRRDLLIMGMFAVVLLGATAVATRRRLE